MMAVLESVSASLELTCNSQELSEAQFKRGMLLATTGIFTILLILLMALAMVVTDQRPWEKN